MNALQVIQTEGLESIGLFYGVYRGIVVDDQDPDNINSLKVSIPGLYNGVTLWALPFHQGGNAQFGFKYLTPKPGEMVYITFERGLPNQALWHYHGWAIGETPSELDNNTIGLITPKGQKVYLKEVEGKLYIETLQEVHIKTKKVFIEAQDIDFIDGKIGIPEATLVKEKLEALETTLNTLQDALRTSNPVPQDGGAAYKAQIVAKLKPNLTITQVDDISSKHIKQPN